MSIAINRRSFLRGMLDGAAVCVALPFLDRFLNGSGTAFADGARLPVRFGAYFWGLGLTDTPTGGTRWVPSKTGRDYEIMPELESLKPVKDKVSVFSGFRAIGDGRPSFSIPITARSEEKTAHSELEERIHSITGSRPAWKSVQFGSIRLSGLTAGASSSRNL